MPANKITRGMVHGDLKPTSTANEAPIKTHLVMVLFTDLLKSFRLALMIKAIDIGFKKANIKNPAEKFW